MITMSNFGVKGRLGNQLFQYASIYGMAKQYGHKLMLSPWKYEKYFNGFFPESEAVPAAVPVHEPAFHFTPEYYSQKLKNNKANFSLDGYLQSPKYWKGYEKEIKKDFSFNPGVLDHVKKKYEKALAKEAIAISIRRGDYVDNPNYELLPVTYYFLALLENFPDWKDKNIIIFSDEPEYAKEHFGCLENVFFADNYFNNKDKTDYHSVNESAIEQLCLMSLCAHFIICNSTFAWWGAYLGEKKNSKIIRPAAYFSGKLGASNNIKDHYPESWISFDHKEKKIDLSDVTFTVPVMYDHPDRKQNLELSICMLQKNFDTNIVIGEQGGRRFEYMGLYCDYVNFSGLSVFHRTKMLNEMARESKTPIVINWDADVNISPVMIWMAAEMIRQGADCAYPYDGRFARVPRTPWFPKIEKSLDVGIFAGHKFAGTSAVNDKMSVGGAVAFNKEKFFEGGAENEFFITYGPEDAERFERFTKIGFIVRRVLGMLYHIDHWCGPNSSMQHPNAEANRKEWHKVRNMSKSDLLNYINTWTWK